MSRRTILRFARPTTLQAILDGIVSRTNAKQGSALPKVTTLRPAVADEIDLPVYVDFPPEGNVGLVFCEEHYPGLLPGEPPLIVGLRPLPKHGAELNGVFSGSIVVSAWQHEDYPLSPKEVEWSIARDCGCEDHEWFQVSLCWEKFNAIVHDDLQDLVLKYEADNDLLPAEPQSESPDELAPAPGDGQAISGPIGHEQGLRHGEEGPLKKPKGKRNTDPSHRGTRQPRKISSRFLMDNMRPLDNLYDVEHLFHPYCHVYEDNEGHLPANPRASFNEAAQSCAERILRERGQN